MTSESALSMRNAFPRPPMETAGEARTMGAGRTTGADPLGSRSSTRSTDAGSNAFGESMSRAMRERTDAPRRTSDPAANEARSPERARESAMDRRSAGRTEEPNADPSEPARESAETPSEAEASADGHDGSTASSVEPPIALPVWNASVAQGTDKGAGANEGDDVPTSQHGPRPSDATDLDASARDATASPADGDAPTTAGGEDAPVQARRSFAAASDAAGLDSNIGTADARGEAASEATNAASPGALAQPGGTEAPARSADFLAQLAHARGVPIPNAQATAETNLPGAPVAHRVELPASPADAWFAGRFAAEIALLGAAGMERAEIQLQPRELGPIRVELSLNGESARIAFSATQPETRQAIEQSLAILKDLLAERGLSLGQASVSDGRAGHDADGERSADAAADRRGGDTSAAAGRAFPDATTPGTRRRTLLDVYV